MPSTHPWAGDVLGGVGQPRILTLANNLVSNPYLDDEDISEWTGQYYSRVEYGNAYSQYALKINYTTLATGYIEFDISSTGGFAGKTFLFSANIVSTQGFKIQFIVDGTDTFGETFPETAGNVEKIAFAKKLENFTDAGAYLKLRVYGWADDSGGGAPYSTSNGQLYIDNIWISQAQGDYTLPFPNNGESLLFQKKQQGRSVLMNGLIQHVNKRFQPVYSASWSYWDDLYELYRQYLVNKPALFIFPHNDVPWGFLGTWDTDLERRYAFGKYFGHEADVLITGMEYFYQLPIQKSEDLISGGIYVEDSLVFI